MGKPNSRNLSREQERVQNQQIGSRTLASPEIDLIKGALREFMKQNGDPKQGTFILSQQARGHSAAQAIRFDLEEGIYIFDQPNKSPDPLTGGGSTKRVTNSAQIAKASIQTVLAGNVKGTFGRQLDVDSSSFGSDGKLVTGIYRGRKLKSVMVLNTDFGRFLCGYFASYAPEEARTQNQRVMLAAAILLATLRPEDCDLHKSMEQLLAALMRIDSYAVRREIKSILVAKPASPILSEITAWQEWKKAGRPILLPDPVDPQQLTVPGNATGFYFG